MICLLFSSYRIAIDQGEYKHVDNCKDISLLASAFKLFLRELPVPLITREVRKALFSSQVDFERKADPKLLADSVKKAVLSLDPLQLRVLKFVFRHMKKMSDIKGYTAHIACIIYSLKFYRIY